MTMKSNRGLEIRVGYTIVAAVTMACAMYLSAVDGATGNAVVDFCGEDTTDLTGFGYCMGAVDGVGTALVLTGHACIPAGVTIGQTVKMVVKKLDEHPELLDKMFPITAAYVIADAWPCIPELDEDGRPILDMMPNVEPR